MKTVALEKELLEGIERFIAHRDEPPREKMSHADAVNVIVRDWLMGQGYLALPADRDAVMPADDITPALDAARVPR